MTQWNMHLQWASWAEATVIFAGAYLVGCFATGYYLVRFWLHRDVRLFGSGNTGARNVGRLLGKTGFLVTLAGDFGKGALAIWGVHHFTQNTGALALALLGVVIGHLWPFQLKFQGGKGVATSLGGLCLFDFTLLLGFGIFTGLGFLMFRRTTPAGLLAFVLLPAASWYVSRDATTITALSVLAGLVLLAHRRNISEEFHRLWNRPDARHNHPEI